MERIDDDYAVHLTHLWIDNDKPLYDQKMKAFAHVAPMHRRQALATLARAGARTMRREERVTLDFEQLGRALEAVVKDLEAEYQSELALGNLEHTHA